MPREFQATLAPMPLDRQPPHLWVPEPAPAGTMTGTLYTPWSRRRPTMAQTATVNDVAAQLANAARAGRLLSGPVWIAPGTGTVTRARIGEGDGSWLRLKAANNAAFRLRVALS